MISKEDMELARRALDFALSQGAAKARATLVRSTENIVATLDGEIDRITHCEDSSLSFALFVDGRYGSFSTNKLDEDSLKAFLVRSIGIARMLAVDTCRDLPAPERCCRNALTGNELGLVDQAYDSLGPEDRKRIALDAALRSREGVSATGMAYKVISEEGEYSDSVYDTIVMDTSGLCCRHSENCFDYGVEVTVEAEGEKYCSYWWHSSSKLSDLDYRSCGETAEARAAAQIGSDAIPGGRMNMVVDSDVASKMVSPILNALSAYSIQQNNSFLADSLGKKVFHEGFNLVDDPHIFGQTCSKLFDSEGVATARTPIVENGVVKQYFVNSYMAAKMGMAPTVEDATRPSLAGWPRPGLTRSDIMGLCGSGILVTDFNGGNSNSSTGDFSYGIEGFEFVDGKIVRPVSGMLITGNFIRLWNNFLAAGSDARQCMSKLIPTLAFANVDFSG